MAAVFNLANRYYLAKDLAKAAELYAKAAESGHTEAIFILGVCYDNGEGVCVNPVKAIELYTKAAKSGHVNATYNIGVCYDKAGDPNKAAEWYAKAAEKGHADATFNLAICYDHGQGVAVDHVRAAELYAKGAEKGHVSSMYNLGVCYDDGEGVVKDRTRAAELYAKAAAKGHAKAAACLKDLQASKATPKVFKSSFVESTKKHADYTKIRDDGSCYWRCLLVRVRHVFGLPDSVDFANGTGPAVFSAVNNLRSDVASYVDHLVTNEPDEWAHVNIVAQQFLEEHHETLQAWMSRMRTPVQRLQGKDRWADEIVFAVTPRMFAHIGVNIDVRVKQWVRTDEEGHVLGTVDYPHIEPVNDGAIKVDLRYYVHENGDGYHYDLLTSSVAATAKRKAPCGVVEDEDTDTDDDKVTQSRAAKKRRSSGARYDFRPRAVQPVHPSILENHTKTCMDGTRLKGRFVDGYLEGYGVQYDCDGDKIAEGQYRRGELHGQGTTYYPNGNIEFTGKFIDGVFSRGRMYNEGGELQYQGEFWTDREQRFTVNIHDFERHGWGIQYSEGVKWYEGQFRCDRPNGRGTVFDDDGRPIFNGVVSGWKHLEELSE